MRKTETRKDYSTLTDDAINYYVVSDLKALTELLQNKMPEGKMSKKDLIKVSVSLNNLLKDLEK